MIKKYQPPRILEVLDATEVIQGAKTIGGMDSVDHNDDHLTTPAYPADE